MENIINNYRMIEEVKERAVKRGSGVEDYAAGFSDYHS